jgi:hypothetical protein
MAATAGNAYDAPRSEEQSKPRCRNCLEAGDSRHEQAGQGAVRQRGINPLATTARTAGSAQTGMASWSASSSGGGVQVQRPGDHGRQLRPGEGGAGVEGTRRPLHDPPRAVAAR